MATTAEEQAQIQAVLASMTGGGEGGAPAEAAFKPVHEQVAEAIAEADEAIAEFVPAEEETAEEDAPPAPAPSSPAETDDDDPIGKYIASAREKRGGIHEASSKAERIVADAEARSRKMLADADAHIKEQIRSAFALMSSNPLAAAEQFRVPAADVMRTAAEAADPTFALKQAMREELARAQAEIDGLKARAARDDEEKAARGRVEAQEKFTRAQQTFLDSVTEDKFPAAVNFWGKKRLLAEAQEEVAEIRAAADALGARADFTDEQIVKRLEKRAREELMALSDKLLELIPKVKTSPGKEAPKGKEKTPPPAKRPPPRTLIGASSASGRASSAPERAVPKTAADDKAQLRQIASMLDAMKGKKKTKVA